jgi:hypothetical protein
VESDSGGVVKSSNTPKKAVAQFDPCMKYLLLGDAIEISPHCELAQELDSVELPNTSDGRDFSRAYLSIKGVTFAMMDKKWWIVHSVRKVTGTNTTVDGVVCLLRHRCKCNPSLTRNQSTDTWSDSWPFDFDLLTYKDRYGKLTVVTK